MKANAQEELKDRMASLTTIYEADGCEACNGTGFAGRKPIYEFLRLSDSIRELIMQRAVAKDIKEAAIREGMTTLLDSGWEWVAKGETNPNELIRVTQQD